MKHTLMRWSALLLLTLGATAASAGGKDIDIRLFEPAPDDQGALSVLGSRVPGSFESVFGLSLDFARNPMIMIDPGRSEAREAVGATLSADLMATMGIIDLFQVSLTLPIGLYTGGDGVRIGDDISASGLGDIRLLVKWQILDRREYPVGFAFANALAFPSAAPRGSFLGGADSGVLYEPRLIVDAKLGPALLVANLGYRTRPPSELLGLRVGDEWHYSAGAVFSVLDDVDLLGELFGATTAHAPFGSREVQHTLEGILGGRYRPGSDVAIRAGVGFGLLPGYGSPQFRIIVGLTWAPKLGEPKTAPEPEPVAPAPTPVPAPTPAPEDSDDDGLIDPDDTCPDQAEDKDGFEDTDGCPDEDNDKDGIKDVDDKCPDKPESKNDIDDEDGCPEGDEDKDGVLDAIDGCPADAEDPDGFEDQDGCPDRDNDKDGFNDSNDSCPDQAEDADGHDDLDGCPDPDNDGDGVNDDADKCRDVPEDADGFEDADGCPDPDNDKDGVLDAKDKCPNEPETINGVKDKDGCPDEGAVKVVVTAKRIEIKDKIYFARGRARIQKRSFSLLNQVAQVLVAHPRIKKLRIEGHTDSAGPRTKNMKLSTWRAKEVLKYLVRRGVAKDRLEAVGLGPDNPIADNKTKVGRASNRRVEFHIADQAKQDVELPALVPPPTK